MKSTPHRFVSTRLAASVLASCLAVSLAHAETWTGLGDGINWEDGENWSNSVLPFSGGTNAQGEAAIGNGASVNLSSPQNINMVRVGAGAGLSGTLNILNGTNLDATFGSNQNSRIGAGNGGTGTVNHSGGSARYHILQIGLDANATGTYNLSDGTFIIGREASGDSLQIGSNGTGTFTVSGGDMTTRAGVRLGTPTTGLGTFRVNGSAATRIGIGTEGSVDGRWIQNSGSTLDLRFDAGGVTKIFIDQIGTGGNVEFAAGSLLNVDFLTTSVAGTWVVMEWEGTLTNNGLAFANTVDTDIWSFSIDSVAKTLSVTAIPEPSSYAALAGLGALFLAAVRRRR